MYQPSIENVEVILDSSADCPVVPLEAWYDVGQKSNANFEPKEERGRFNTSAEMRGQVEFIMTNKDGTNFVNKRGWSIQYEPEESSRKQMSYFKKDEVQIPLWYEQNS